MNKRKKFKWILLLLILGSTIGFAMFNTRLNIGGLARINGGDVVIHWDPDSIVVAEGSATASTPAYVSDNEKRLVDFVVAFEYPGDYYEFTVDAKNYGALTGSIGALGVGFYEEDGVTAINKPDYLKYSFTYADGSEVKIGDELRPQQSKKYKVRVEYDYDNPASGPDDPIRIIIGMDPEENTHYQITFDANGGSIDNDGIFVSTLSRTINKGDVVGDLPMPANGTKLFLGWYTSSSGGTQISSSTIPTSSTTYFAHWETTIVTISYDANGGTIVSSGAGVTLDNDIVFQNGSEYHTQIDYNEQIGSTGLINYNNSDGIINLEKTGSVVIPTKEWINYNKTIAYDQSKIYTASDFCNASEEDCNIKLSVNWISTSDIENPPSYTLTYDSQGGTTCSPSTITKQLGEKWVDTDNSESVCTPTNGDYGFAGWYDSPSGGEKINFEEASAYGNITVYAQWKNIYTLTYSDSDLKGIDDELGMCHGQTLERMDGEVLGRYCNPKKTGYKFKGWFIGDEHIYFNIYKLREDTTVYAKWETTSTLTYHDGPGCTSKSVTHFYGDNSTWGTLCTPKKPGYSFVEWRLIPGGGGAPISNNTVISGDLNVYAKWTPNVCTITYNPNGGTFNSNSNNTKQTISYGSSDTTRIAYDSSVTGGGFYNASKNHYHVSNYYAWITADGSQFKQNMSYTAKEICPNLDNSSQSVTFKVNWVKDSYTLTYNANGGDISDCTNTTVTKKYNEKWFTSTSDSNYCVPKTRACYEFVGWNTKADGTGSTISTTSVAQKNITVYAKWKQYKAKVYYNANGGSLTGNGDSNITLSDNMVYYKNKLYYTEIGCGNLTDSDGLIDYDNNVTPFLDLKRTGYSVPRYNEWYRKSDGTTYHQAYDYTRKYPRDGLTFSPYYSSSAFCDARYGDCSLTVYVNWQKN